MEDVRSQLECNNPDGSEHVVFTYSKELVNENMLYFFRSFRQNLSPYKALTFFSYWLEEQRNLVDPNSQLKC